MRWHKSTKFHGSKSHWRGLRNLKCLYWKMTGGFQGEFEFLYIEDDKRIGRTCWTFLYEKFQRNPIQHLKLFLLKFIRKWKTHLESLLHLPISKVIWEITNVIVVSPLLSLDFIRISIRISQIGRSYRTLKYSCHFYNKLQQKKFQMLNEISLKLFIQKSSVCSSNPFVIFSAQNSNSSWNLFVIFQQRHFKFLRPLQCVFRAMKFGTFMPSHSAFPLWNCQNSPLISSKLSHLEIEDLCWSEIGWIFQMFPHFLNQEMRQIFGTFVQFLCNFFRSEITKLP